MVVNLKKTLVYSVNGDNNIFVASLKRTLVNNIKNILTQAYFEFYAP